MSADRGLDPALVPMIEKLEAFEAAAAAAPHKRLTLSLVRQDGCANRFSMTVFDGQPEKNDEIVERVVKTLLWTAGGHTLYVSGDRALYRRLKAAYAPGGARAYDAAFMRRIFDRPFEVRFCAPESLPPEKRCSRRIGGHYAGSRIGFDAGGSDRKVSAVRDGEVLYSEEVQWLPKVHADPLYHYNEIYAAFRRAAEVLDNRVDAVGVSSAGICLDNQVKSAALFRAVPKSLYDKHVRHIYTDVAKRFGDMPVTVENDGDVAALAGYFSGKKGRLLGLAMGTSEAAGYVDAEGGLNGWLNELGYVPLCFNRDVRDEISGDYGTGAKYLCQEGVIRLSARVGHVFSPQEDTPAKKLKSVQNALERERKRYAPVFETMGLYLGYAVAYYARFYDIGRLLLLGRVTSGAGGEIILAAAREIVCGRYGLPVEFVMPDEIGRRLSQSIVAASL
ncbi:MAG: ROK family protein [Clostridiales bacterium]|jgi:predicted NBD/HSP70 family sugar kinase|nr:ROK family protein [Clostridiales bacterium]